MDPVDIMQLVFAGTTALVLGRVGLAMARFLERRLSGTPGLGPETEDKLRAVEDECAMLRQELSELQERQDFTERVLHQDPSRVRLVPSDGAQERAITPH